MAQTISTIDVILGSKTVGGDPDGKRNSVKAVNDANELARARGGKVIVRGQYLLEKEPNPFTVIHEGAGYTSSPDWSARAPSCYLKAFDTEGAAITLADDAMLRYLQVDNLGGGRGDNIHVLGTRAGCDHVSSTHAGQENYRVGSYEAKGNSNCWELTRCIGIQPGRHNLMVHHEGGSDAMAGTASYCDFRSAGGDNIHAGSTAWSTFIGNTCQGHGAGNYAFRITAMARSLGVIFGDLEGEGLGLGVIEAWSFSHDVTGPLYGGPAWEDLSGLPGMNRIRQYDSRRGRFVDDGDEVLDRAQLRAAWYAAATRSRSAPAVELWRGARQPIALTEWAHAAMVKPTREGRYQARPNRMAPAVPAVFEGKRWWLGEARGKVPVQLDAKLWPAMQWRGLVENVANEAQPR